MSAPRRSILFVSALLLAGSGCAASGGAAAGLPAAGVQVGQPMPDLPLTPMNGGAPRRLASLRGKVVLLDIWAAWCAPCRDELPMLDDIAARMKDAGVEIVAVSIDEEKDKAQAFLASRPRWSLTLVHDPEGEVPRVLQPPKMPTSYVVDAQGVLRHVNAGFVPADAARIEAQLRALAAAR